MTIEWLCCILAAAASLFYVFYLPGKLYFGPEKTRASYLRERKTRFTRTCATSISNTKPAKFRMRTTTDLKASLQDEAATLLAEIARLEANAPAPRKARS